MFIMETERIYGGLLLREDGWYKWYTDGQKHYSYEKFNPETDIPDENWNDHSKHTL